MPRVESRLRGLNLLAGILACLLAAGIEAWCAAPENDLCGGALLVPAAGPFPIFSEPVDVAAAGAAGDPASACSATVSRSVWYRFQPAEAGLYSLSVGADTLTTVRDTVMALYVSPAGCAGPLTEIACSDDEGDGQASALLVPLEAGTQYFAVAWVFDTNALNAGETTVQLRVAPSVPPPNDDCTQAEVIPAEGPFPFFTELADLAQAGTANDPSAPVCQDVLSRSVWYQFTPATTSFYRFSTCDDTSTTVGDTVLGVYFSAGGCGGPFAQLACSDDACSSSRSAVETVLTAGVTYHVVVWEFGEDASIPGQTLVQLRIDMTPPMFTPSTWLPDGRLFLHFTAPAGHRYEVQSSVDLANWSTLGDAESLGSGSFQFTVTDTNSPARFFRVRLP